MNEEWKEGVWRKSCFPAVKRGKNGGDGEGAAWRGWGSEDH